MEHLTTIECIDFVRQQVGTAQITEIQRHLSAGCLNCRKSVRIWRRVMEFANREGSFSPPAYALELVESSFSANRAAFDTEEYVLAHLLFDSAVQPVAAGLRATASLVRQLLYRAGNVCIDMRVQPRLGSDSTFIIGQLLNPTQPEHGLSGIPVALLRQGETLSRARTNAVGEFDFDIDDCGSEIQLVVGVDKQPKIVVPVPTSENAPAIT